MKKIIILLLLSNTAFFAKASVLLVNNTTAGAGQYAVIDSAMVHANAGDTIYVSGSNITYAVFTITKSIVVMGQGSFSDKQNGFPSKVNGFKCNSNLSNIKVKGLYLIGTADFGNKTNVSHVEFSGNYCTDYLNFNPATNFSFFNIANNIFGTQSLYRIEFYGASGFSNIVIQNNLFFGNIRSLGASNSLVSNNVFYNTGNAFDFFGASPFTNAIIMNNIFYDSNPINNTVGCTYSNNLSFSPTITYPSMSGSGNLNNINPDFINVLSGAYSSAFNFHLQAGSAAIGAASNGGDIGFYGGTYKSSVSGETENTPIIRKMDIININLPQNGNVNVKVRSTKAR